MGIGDRIPVLERVDLFAALPSAALPSIAASMAVITVGAGSVVFHKGEFGDSMYIVADGRVRVHDAELVLNTLEAGAVFGEMALLDAEVRSASVTAVVETTLFRFDQQVLHALLSTHSEVARGIIHVLCQRLRVAVRHRADDHSYLQQVARLTAAAHAVEAGAYQRDLLDDVAQREDALGQLARVFQRMADEVQSRERWLQQQVTELRIEIDRGRQRQQVAEITQTEYFRQLQRDAAALRSVVGNGGV